MITLTCGHNVEDLDDVVNANIKGWTREHTPCVDYVTYCVPCWSKALHRGDILLSQDEETEWLEHEDEVERLRAKKKLIHDELYDKVNELFGDNK